MSRMTTLSVLAVFLYSGCASVGPSGTPASQSRFRQARSVESERHSAAVRRKIPRFPPDSVKSMMDGASRATTTIISVPLYPLTMARLMYEYDKAEREGGILP